MIKLATLHLKWDKNTVIIRYYYQKGTISTDLAVSVFPKQKFKTSEQAFEHLKQHLAQIESENELEAHYVSKNH